MNFFRIVNNLFRFNRTNWKAVSLCFLAATVFWFFNALNKEYASNIRFKLQFDFDEHKFVQASPLPREVSVNVSGNGWDILRKYLGVQMPALVIPLERPVETKKIVGSTLPPLLASQLGTLKINHIVTDTLYISIEPKDSLKVRVQANVESISFKQGYGRVSPVVVLPDSIRVDGPRSIISRIPHTIVVQLPAKKMSDNYREQLEVLFPQTEAIKRNPPVVDVMFEVGEIIEVETKIALNVTHVPYPNHVLKDRDTIQCTIQIPKGRIEDLTLALNSARAEIDLRDARIGSRKEMPTIAGLPSYATLVKSDSVRLRLY